MPCWVGVDYGTKRIGLAVADHSGSIASPAGVIAAAGSAPGNAAAVTKWAKDYEPAGFVVGLPLNMDGSHGAQANICEKFANELAKRSALPVELWDERLSSFQADVWMTDAGLTRAGRKKRRDSLAAMVILQSFLDARDGDAQDPDAINS